MRGSFSDIIRQKVEESPVLKKTVIRLLSFSLSLGLILSSFIYSFFNPLLLNLKEDKFFVFVIIVMISILIGALGGLLIFCNMLINIKTVVNELSNENPRWEWLEKEYMESEIRSAYLAIKKLHFTVSSQSKLIGISQIASQVAHDIRSPLTAINIAVSDMAAIPENRRIMIRNACKRINDIANNLLSQPSNTAVNKANFIDEAVYPELIYLVIENIISEKNYEYQKKYFKVIFESHERAYTCFSKINLAIFKRILSNLINNAVEAVKPEDPVRVCLNCNDQFIDITIQDKGCGIAPNILPKITEEGFSFGKEKGAGFGLFHAKKEIDKINGSLIINSEEGVGTVVNIKLQRSNLPQWFCEKLHISHEDSIVILDDDPSIHDSWIERFSLFPNIKITHYSTAHDLLTQTNKNAALYLVDFELLGENTNGLDVIEHLGLNHRSILVTNSFEDISVRNSCNGLGIKIIPKYYVQFIPIVISDNNSIVFIDDNESMQMAWLFAAEEAGKKIDVYAHPNEFLKLAEKYSKETIIYIDYELGENLNGEIYAKQFYENGFREIHLATGHPADKFKRIPWVKSIVGKNPPFNTPIL